MSSELPWQYELLTQITDKPLNFTPAGLMNLITNELTPREFKVIELRYRDHLSLEQTAKRFDVTRERIRQVEIKAIRKLSSPHTLLKYSAVPYEVYQSEQEARKKAEDRLDWLLQKAVTVTDNYEVTIDPNSELLKEKIGSMDLSVRSYNCLTRAGLRTVKDIVNVEEEPFYEIRNLGVHSANEIISKIHERGLLMKWERD